MKQLSGISPLNKVTRFARQDSAMRTNRDLRIWWRKEVTRISWYLGEIVIHQKWIAKSSVPGNVKMLDRRASPLLLHPFSNCSTRCAKCKCSTSSTKSISLISESAESAKILTTGIVGNAAKEIQCFDQPRMIRKIISTTCMNFWHQIACFRERAPKVSTTLKSPWLSWYRYQM